MWRRCRLGSRGSVFVVPPSSPGSAARLSWAGRRLPEADDFAGLRRRVTIHLAVAMASERAAGAGSCGSRQTHNIRDGNGEDKIFLAHFRAGFGNRSWGLTDPRKTHPAARLGFIFPTLWNLNPVSWTFTLAWVIHASVEPPLRTGKTRCSSNIPSSLISSLQSPLAEAISCVFAHATGNQERARRVTMRWFSSAWRDR